MIYVVVLFMYNIIVSYIYIYNRSQAGLRLATGPLDEGHLRLLVGAETAIGVLARLARLTQAGKYE